MLKTTIHSTKIKVIYQEFVSLSYERNKRASNDQAMFQLTYIITIQNYSLHRLTIKAAERQNAAPLAFVEL